MTAPWQPPWISTLLARRELGRLALDILMRSLLVVGACEIVVEVWGKDLAVFRGLWPPLAHAFLLGVMIPAPLYWLAFRPAAERAARAAGVSAGAQFQAVVEAVTDALLVSDSQGQVLFANPAAGITFGCLQEALLGRPLGELLPAQETPASPEAAARFRAAPPERRGRRADGTLFPAEVSAGVARVTGEELRVTVVRDVTRRKETERELERLASFPRLDPNPILECDAAGRVTYANPAALRLLQELGGPEPVARLLPPDLPALVQRSLEGCRESCRAETTVNSCAFLWSLHPLPNLHCVRVYGIDITPRKHAEDALRVSEERYRTLAEAAPDAIFVVDRAGAFQYVNSFAAAQHGRKPEEMIGRSVREFFPPQITARWEQSLAAMAQSGELIFEEEKVPIGRSEFWMSTKVVPLRDAAGEVTAALGISRDVTARKQAEEALRKLSSAVEQTADPVFITGTDGSIEYVNPAFEKVTGYQAQEVLGKKPSLLKSGKHARDFYERLWQTILSGQTWRGTFINRKKDGSEYFAETSIAPIFSAGEGISHFVSVEKDMTERTRAEEALRESEERFRTLVDALPVTVRVIQESRLAFTNPAGAVLYGYATPEEMREMDAFSLVADQDVPRLREYMQKRAAGEPVPTRYEFHARRRDGAEFPAEAIVARISFRHRPATLAVVLDLTERKRLRLFESLLPVCCMCGKVRDDKKTQAGKGSWRPLEEYVVEYSDADLTHTFCPACYRAYREKEGLPPGEPPAE